MLPPSQRMYRACWQALLNSTLAPNLNLKGNITYIISSLSTVITSQSWNSIFIYNTDINKFYVLQGDYWAWSGNNPLNELSTERAIGTTLQRPTGVDVGFIYYDVDLSKYLTWNGLNWLGIVLTELREEFLENKFEIGYLTLEEFKSKMINSW